MWNWLRRWFSGSVETREAGLSVAGAEEEFSNPALAELTVQPDEEGEFEVAACEHLLQVLQNAGIERVNDVFERSVAVSLEDFFEGNHNKASIAANVVPQPPYDRIDAWYELLNTIRSTDQVSDVLVGISMIEPYEDGRLGMWPYADAIWVYSSLGQGKIEALLSPLEPDEVVDVRKNSEGRNLAPPYPPVSPVKAYWVWWD